MKLAKASPTYQNANSEETLFRKVIITALYFGLVVSFGFLIADTFFNEFKLAKFIPELGTVIMDSILLYLVYRYNIYRVAGAILICVGNVFLVATTVQNSGIHGSWMLYVFPTAMGAGLIFSGPLRTVLAVWGILAIVAIICIQAFSPQLITSGGDSLLDFGINYLVVFLLLILATSYLKNNLDKEKETVSQRTKEIETQNKLLLDQKLQIQTLNKELKDRLNERGAQLSHALREVSQREAYLKSLIDSQTTFLVRITPTGQYKYVNKAFHDRFLSQAYEMEEMLFSDSVEKKTSNTFQSIVHICFRHPGVSHKTIFKQKSLNGDWIYVDWEFISVNAQEIQAVGIEITDLMEAQQDLTKYATKLEKMTDHLTARNKELTDFGYIISHNLRGSVANILGLTELLQQVVAKNDEDAHIVDILQKSTDNLDQVIKDLNMVIDLRQFEKHDFQTLRFTDIVNQALLQLEDRIQQSNARIHLNFDPDFQLISIKPYLNSIIYNLISNGIKYHHPDRDPEITITLKITDSQVMISICDNGIGIDMDKYGQQLFSLYKRFHDHVEGKGMGLYLVKVQVESMGGKIRVNSTVNEGTCFQIILEQEVSAVTSLINV